MPDTTSASGVLLAENQSAMQLLHAALRAGASSAPEVFDTVDVPASSKTFRNGYRDLLPRFEAARLASDQRLEIGEVITSSLRERIDWRDASGARPLADALAGPAEPLPIETHAFDGKAGWTPNIVYRGERWAADRMAEFGRHLVDRGVMSVAAGDALAWVHAQALDGGAIDLSGRKIAVLGAGAEMAPTRLWLEAGADVLWLDTEPPPESWWDTAGMSGRIHWPPGNADLLSQPREIRATLEVFADGHPLDVGLYAYAPGRARELRLTACMNALVEALPEALVRTVTMLVSPTTPTTLSPDELDRMQARRDTRPRWEAICQRLGLFGSGGGCSRVGKAATTRTIVTTQGASYQAAQYLAKTLTAERWAQAGVRVSANTAAITRTRSMAHPVFAAAFGGAAAFGVETLTPRQSRRINGLLSVHDWLHPDLPVPGSVRVHGALHALPYPLEPALRVAAAIGFARSPRLLKGLFAR